MKLELRNLSVGYDRKRPVVSDINLQLENGKLTCLIGANGTGKSTLLKTLIGFLPPLSGHLSVDDRDLTSFSRQELSTTISVVLAQQLDIENLTVTEVISLGRSPYTNFMGHLTARDNAVIDDVFTIIGITSLKQRLIKNLSDGERQKVMIARALAQETPIIYLDEPTAFLDFKSKVETFSLLKRMANEFNKLILFSTHDLELAIRFADQLLEIKNHQLVVTNVSDVQSEMSRIMNLEN